MTVRQAEVTSSGCVAYLDLMALASAPFFRDHYTRAKIARPKSTRSTTTTSTTSRELSANRVISCIDLSKVKRWSSTSAASRVRLGNPVIEWSRPRKGLVGTFAS